MAGKRRTCGKSVNGILLLDKPPGKSSNQVLQSARRLFNANKAGHTGTLDRAATGLLAICFGCATKLSGFLLDADKSYRVRCRLGIETTTGDAEGDIVGQKPVGNYSTADLEQVLRTFAGDSEQTPPMYSALKHKGQRLYKLAYEGISVARKPRKITIYRIKLLDHTSDSLLFEVHCSKGVYIRSLVEDIGKRLGCGAHVHELRRLHVGPFNAAQMISPDDIEKIAQQGHALIDKLLLPMDAALRDMDSVHLDENSARSFRQGQAVLVPHAPEQGLLRVYDEQRAFFAVGEAGDDGRITPKRLIVP